MQRVAGVAGVEDPKTQALVGNIEVRVERAVDDNVAAEDTK